MMLTLDRSRTIGLATGSLWLIAVAGFFAAWSLLMIDTAGARWVLGAAAIPSAALLLLGVVVIRAASRLPRPTRPRAADERLLGRRFALVVGLEVIALAILNPLLAARGHVTVLPSLNLVIIGLHFLPLAWLFHVPRYYVMGLLFCVIPARTLWWFPAQSHVGSALSWFVISGLGCGAVAVVIGAAGLGEVAGLKSSHRRATG